MTRERRLPDYVADMRLAASDAVSFLGGMSLQAFEADRKTQRAVIMCLIIIGEASARIVERHLDFVDHHSSLPWHEMRGLRNRIVHGYSGINLEIVYQTVRTSLPSLVAHLDGINVEE
ncbi:HepT-like ribonuclease domain-containing protein [Rhizobium sp. C4]|uniref:HepT-like ribonuclease domain-containing protein n=1 Tax=Rhizobium sp. C4 TaxID=1349800 RepID=UPI001E6047F0|nr:DUF86 domain-containing protein [Rhizobium sp. C4]MCD2174188.1 DUF86 domain-containing protein [Rhizobium sp. C4]